MRCLKCFSCGNTAMFFHGHVHKNDLVLTVGWCRICTAIGIDQKTEFTACAHYPTGCLGEWRYQFGISKS